MKRSIDHDRFVEKNRSIANSQELDNKDTAMEKKGYSYLQRQQEASCFNCKMKPKCPEFRNKKTGGSTGVVSFGGGESFVCSRYTPAVMESRSMSGKQIKSLLKNAKRGLR
jgi:hypothetical protein